MKGWDLFGIILFLACLWCMFTLGSIYEQDKLCNNGNIEFCYNKQ